MYFIFLAHITLRTQNEIKRIKNNLNVDFDVIDEVGLHLARNC